MAREFLEVLKDWEDYRPVRQSRISERAMAEALNLLTNADGMPSHRHRYLLQEAITTSDFPVLLGGVLDRQVLALYEAAPSPWRAYVPINTLPDFRDATREKMQGNQDVLPLVAEKTEYPETPMAASRYVVNLAKRGRRFDISWESEINDVYNVFADLAERFANAATYTEAFLATGIYATAAGPNPALFGAPINDVDGQDINNLGNLALTIQNLEIAIDAMATQTDIEGRPLSLQAVHLVVPQLLRFTALNILNSTSVQWVDEGLATLPMPMNNAVSQVGIQLHVDPMLPVIDTSGDVNTTWYLFADPQGSGRFGEVNFLRGHESPEIVMKASNKVTLGGDLLDPMGGDFATDNILWRVRHCLGSSPLDPRFAIAQVG